MDILEMMIWLFVIAFFSGSCIVFAVLAVKGKSSDERWFFRMMVFMSSTLGFLAVAAIIAFISTHICVA